MTKYILISLIIVPLCSFMMTPPIQSSSLDEQLVGNWLSEKKQVVRQKSLAHKESGYKFLKNGKFVKKIYVPSIEPLPVFSEKYKGRWETLSESKIQVMYEQFGFMVMEVWTIHEINNEVLEYTVDYQWIEYDWDEEEEGGRINDFI